MTARPSPSLPREHAATAETRPARLLRALAQNPEPLSAPALASLLAEPGRRRRLADLLRPGSAPARASRPRRTSRPRALKDAAGPPSSGVSPPQAAAGSTNTTKHQPSPRPPPQHKQNRTGTAHGHRTGPCTGRSPRHLQPPDSADQPQTRRPPAQRTRLHPRPDRRRLPRQQREDPPGPPLGPGGTQTPEKAEAAQAPQPNATPAGSVNIRTALKAPRSSSAGDLVAMR